MLGDLELHGTNCRQDRRLVTAQVRTKHLDHALVVELMSLRDRSREVRAAKALGPGALEVFRT